ncbi:uncharacterized protein LOC112341104 [Selaginella moellendorffii]|uniref:uncharacterized protein LOC112341104 n=1 Tax=Selaginella moellendorffii TaxID=88036 RepID=UPI000D1C8397|nr:uncharacterized protein LOC112341104 [Selaginella moellendorffii]|eukprot:XP_024516379.1 uncharacterized protein LOC112341104 [Selaginella moellendorffii]
MAIGGLARALLRRRATGLAVAKRFQAGYCNAAAQGQGFTAPPPPEGAPSPQGQGFQGQGNFSSQGQGSDQGGQGFAPQGGEDYAEAEDFTDPSNNSYEDYSPGGPIYDAEYSSPPPYQSQQEQQQQEYYVPPPPPPPPPPKPRFDNKNVPITLVSLGRAMQLKFQNQKEFESMLDKASAFGVMLPDEPGNITRELAELDPKKVYAVVDMKAVLKSTKRLAEEEAERSGYPKDFMRMRNKYGKYDSDDD